MTKNRSLRQFGLGMPLRDCPDCRAFSRAYAEVVRLTGELEADDIPNDVRDRVREALRERAKGSDRLY